MSLRRCIRTTRTDQANHIPGETIARRGDTEHETE